jgi:serine/threonine-protein kinase
VVLEDVMQAERGENSNLNTGAGQFAVSRSGALAYARGGVYPLSLSSLVWVDSTGAPEPLPLPPGGYSRPRFSPDGTHLAYLEGVRGDRQVWVYDIELETPIRLTSTGADVTWSPDGTRLAINLERDGRIQMFSMPADGSEGPQLLAESEESQRVADWSSDGVLAFLQEGDIWTLPMDGDGVPEPFRETAFREAWPAFSPDGRWLAYGSNETGRFEVYVRPFPAGEPLRRVSTAGGAAPLCSPDGRQLFFRTYSKEVSALEMMVVDVATDGSFTRGQPRTLFHGRDFRGTIPVRSYDISPDGRRFVMLKRSSDVEPRPATRINVVLNWFEELNELVPVD